MKWLYNMCSIRAAILVFALTGTAVVNATPISPGFDLFATQPGTFVDLTVQSGGLVGVVQLEGVAFGPGDTDTIVKRLSGSTPGFGVGDVETIDIELVALSLVSVDPVDIGGTLFDVDVISGSLLGEAPNPLGSMDVTHSDPNGGTFNTTFLPINYKAIFTEIGNLVNTFDVLGQIQFLNTQGFWSHTPGPMDMHSPTLPAGGFYAGIDPITGEKVPMDHVTPGEAHFTQAAMIPEPTTFAMLALGLAGLAFTRRRKV